MHQTITISILKKADELSVSHIDMLLHMLDETSSEIDGIRLNKLLDTETFILFVAKNQDENIVGMLTLTCCHTLAREKYWIEDVIVDSRFRGNGIGRRLVKRAVEYARTKEKAPAIYLTSNPSRVSARALYRSEGFEEYETGVFRILG